MNVSELGRPLQHRIVSGQGISREPQPLVEHAQEPELAVRRLGQIAGARHESAIGE